MKLSICIPVFNKWNFTQSCLQDLDKLSGHIEIIAVDNASTDETEQHLIQLAEDNKIIYHRNQTNLGFAKACNQAYRLSSGDNILFLNNDIRVQRDHSIWVDNILNHCDNALVSPTFGELDKKFNFIREVQVASPQDQVIGLLTNKLQYLSGWCLGSSRYIWQKLDLSGRGEIFDERFFVYFDDTDLNFRAVELDIPRMLTYIPVVHFGKVSSKQLNTYQLYAQSREKFIAKWNNKL